jgi:hypothetical protein
MDRERKHRLRKGARTVFIAVDIFASDANGIHSDRNYGGCLNLLIKLFITMVKAKASSILKDTRGKKKTKLIQISVLFAPEVYPKHSRVRGRQQVAYVFFRRCVVTPHSQPPLALGRKRGMEVHWFWGIAANAFQTAICDGRNQA